MSTSYFKVIEHAIPCQSIQEYPHAVKTDNPPLQLAVKQYIPLNNLNPGPDDITIIAGHANGIPKECYEPIWDELLALTSVKIKAIWFADCSHQGASGVLNERILGYDPNWFDHSRDLLCMVNHFRDLVQPPIVGVAHSFSCAQFPSKLGGRSPALWASTRPDLWPSLEAAETYIRDNPFWRKWDKRAVNQYIRFGFRSTPTALYPSSSPGAVTLTTTKAQEAWTYLRFNATPRAGVDNPHDPMERLLGPDVAVAGKEGDNNNRDYVTVSPWPCLGFEFLPYVRPSTLYVFGDKSHINIPDRRREKLQRTGTGLGGNGGVAAGRVRADIIPGTSHLAPLEKVSYTARILSGWLELEIERYRKEKGFFDWHINAQAFV
ncbi:hypothetical protein EYZ11_007741 [Aspergillus tanneri]|uniref:AB hydrolase-1 domain-containing protein n=1 Tax=Aspergillus tanneri TaxID=1220188 RepID=A0A4S3JCF6_9EURO|nr:hypothetical protein EYZ11_007741 [Aspergillus tanneri]